jgi:chromosome segregation ATPase
MGFSNDKSMFSRFTYSVFFGNWVHLRLRYGKPMTRKEPKFSDDLTESVGPPSPDETHRPIGMPASDSKPQTTGLLWLFVLTGLALSFGIALFGLSEAGRYQAALDRAQSQAQALEQTIASLNESQSQGIGELAQSDTQMRQMVASVEKRLGAQVSAELVLVKRSQAEFQQLLDELTQSRATTESEQKMLSEALEVISAQVESSVSSLDEQIIAVSTRVAEESVLLSEQMTNALALAEEQKKLVSSRTEEVSSLFAEQLSIERSRIDALVQAEEVGKQINRLFEAVGHLEQRNKEFENAGDGINKTLKVMQDEIKGLEQVYKELASDASTSLSVELVSEQLERVAQQVDEQGQILKAVDASRRQVAQRMIDLSSRLNAALQPKDKQ